MRTLLFFLSLFALPNLSAACTVRLAVASNFRATLERLVTAYEDEANTEFQIISGASGTLFSQILRGAPFDFFFSADAEKVERLENRGRTFGASWTYAIGRMSLWTPGRNATAVLESNDPIETISIANPKHAPYGAAAASWIEAHWGSDKSVRTVVGANVAQAFHFVKTGNADAGLVALSQLISEGIPVNEYVTLPDDQYPSIRQKAALLRSPACAASSGFARFLRSTEAAAVIELSGYVTGQESE
ncbi:MAG: molybdate ABC transporter substrate-binding protein [Pseudomonadota bacterium]